MIYEYRVKSYILPSFNPCPGRGNGNPLQYSCMEKSPMDSRAWQATVHGVAK